MMTVMGVRSSNLSFIELSDVNFVHSTKDFNKGRGESSENGIQSAGAIEGCLVGKRWQIVQYVEGLTTPWLP